MNNPKVRVGTAEMEAARWHATLGKPPVSTETLEDFFTWRSDPTNADAYRRVETAWTSVGALAGDPVANRTIEEALARRSSKPASIMPKLALGLTAVAASGALAFVGWTWFETRNVYQTAIGEQRLVQLSDGSSVRLDTGSRVRVRYGREARFIDLEQGQAMFTVARDESRPFIVEAGATQVRALGTVFDVRRDAGSVGVTLVSGIVEVAAGGQGTLPRRLSAGQSVEVTLGGVRPRATDVESVTGWTEGRIVFRDTPMVEAVSEVNRYLTDKVELEMGALDGETVNGVFKTGDRDAFVSTASAVFGLRATIRADGSVLLSPDENKSGSAQGSAGV